MAYLTTADGAEIFYNDWGTGQPVVLIHGWPLNSDMWERQAAFLVENGLRVIAYDRRGFGRSSQPWEGYGYDSFAADLQAVMEKLDLHDAVLVGFSMGGGEVVRYLSRFGAGRVSKAVLLAAVPPFLLKTDDNPDGTPAEVYAGIAQQIREDRPKFMHVFGSMLYGRTMLKHTVSDQVLAWTESMAMRGSLRATLGAAVAFSSTDFRAEMKNIEVPFLVIHGGGDETVPAALAGRRSAEILPHATYVELDGEPHGLFWTAADRVNEELRRFIVGA